MNRIRSLRAEKNISMREAAQQLGLPYTTYVNYERGTREPNSETLIALANFYNTSIDYMLGRSNSRNTSSFFSEDSTFDDPQKERVIPIRFLGSVAAGYDHIANDECKYLHVPEEWLGNRQPEDFFALRVVGSSMYPKYCNGDEILCIRDESLPVTGQVCVVIYNGEEATLKKVEFPDDRSWLKLVPINPMYEPKQISGADMEQCRILGKVVRMIRTEIVIHQRILSDNEILVSV